MNFYLINFTVIINHEVVWQREYNSTNLGKLHCTLSYKTYLFLEIKSWDFYLRYVCPYAWNFYSNSEQNNDFSNAHAVWSGLKSSHGPDED